MKFLFYTMMISLFTTFTFAQEIETSKIPSAKFEIADIIVTGAINTDKETIIKLSQLNIGQIITLSGFDISSAIKNILDSEQYSHVEIHEKSVSGDKLSLEIKVEELPVLKDFTFKNISKSKADEFKELLAEYLKKGVSPSPSDKEFAKKTLEDYYKAKGYVNVEVIMDEITRTSEKHSFDIQFEINKNEKVRIAEILLIGNKVVSTEKLKKVMLSHDQTQLIKPTIFIADNIELDKQALIAHYRSLGYLDAKITEERIRKVFGNKKVKIYLQVEEGQQYYFRNITWEGNYKYKDTVLAQLFGFKSGDVFNEQLLNQRLSFSPEGHDVSSIYMNDGHLFYNAEVILTKVEGQYLDINIKIHEGEQAIIGDVTITGNQVTDEAVIRRELRTNPGDKFNRDALVRSQRALMNLGYFNPETLEAIPVPNETTGVVDLEYKVEEKSSDKVELSGSWGGRDVGLVGTAGVQFNNFSLKKALKLEGYQGDGQQLGFRTQFGGRTYQSVNFNFMEPWLGGKKPNRLMVGTSFTNYRSQFANDQGAFERLKIIGANVGYGQRIQIGDETITANTSLQFQQYRLNSWSRGLFQTDDGKLVNNGQYNNLSIKQSFVRSTLNTPLFPTKGSRISFSMSFTPPYSLINGNGKGDTVQENFKWMEYHKWRLDVEKYVALNDRFTLKLSSKLGFMGAYNKEIGISPFERFQLGGDGLTNAQIGFTGIDRITLRGYDVEDITNNFQNGEISATPFFNKFTAEVRMPLSKKLSPTTYLLGFVEAGNAYRSIGSYNPIKLKKSAGIGFRTQLPMFGTFGIDYGIGFDKEGPRTLRNLGQFSFTLGFELD